MPNIIDLFAGAGGFSIGFEQAGFRPLLAIEKDKWAFETYKQNHENDEIILINDSIEKVSTKIRIEELVGRNNIDVIIGGPPCQGFSVANPKKDANDIRNSMYKYFVKWVKYVRPTAFVMENVASLQKAKDSYGRYLIDAIKRDFQKAGYETEYFVLSADEYGVPQIRKRLFIIGNRIGKKVTKPENSLGLTQAPTAWEAISDLPIISAGEGEEEQGYTIEAQNDYQTQLRNSGLKVYNHVAMNHTDRLVNRFSYIQNGCSIESLPDEFKVKKRGGNGELSDIKFQLNYRLIKKEAPCYTIPASFYSNFIHPVVPRNITAREAARIQSFPDTYKFYGKRTMVSNSLLRKKGILNPPLSQYNQIGNSVPPLLAKAIAEHVMRMIS